MSKTSPSKKSAQSNPTKADLPVSRLSMDDDLDVAIKKISGGNKEAEEIASRLSVLVQMIDRDNEKGVTALFHALDDCRIYEKDVVALYRACNDNPYSMIAVLRARNLEVATIEEVRELAASQPGKQSAKMVSGLMFKVMDALPKFSAPAALWQSGHRPTGSGNTSSLKAGANQIPSIPRILPGGSTPSSDREKGGINE